MTDTDTHVEGGCHCGAIRYRMATAVEHHALCHCSDCRRHAGAPMVAWAMVPMPLLTLLKGQPKDYASSEHGRRSFCAECGTGLFYVNGAMLPGMVDVQSATLDNPDAIPIQGQIQTAERIGWMNDLADKPQFERFPGA